MTPSASRRRDHTTRGLNCAERILRTRPWLLALVLAGCGGTSGEPSAGEPWVELGFGERTFTSVEAGDRVTLARGAQGGFHVWVSVRAGGVAPEAVRLRTRIHPEDADRPAQQGIRELTLTTTEDGHAYEVVGLPTVLSYASCFVNRRTAVTLTLTGGGGTVGIDRAVVVPVPQGEGPSDACPHDD